MPRRRPHCRPTFPGSRLVRRADAAPCVLRNSSLEPQFPATSGGSSHRTKLSFALHGLTDLVLYHSAPTVEPILSSHCTSARLFTTLPLTATHTCVHKHELQLTDFHSRNFFASYSNACISRAQSADRHTVDLPAPHVTMHSCLHVASENNNETDRFTQQRQALSVKSIINTWRAAEQRRPPRNALQVDAKVLQTYTKVEIIIFPKPLQTHPVTVATVNQHFTNCHPSDLTPISISKHSVLQLPPIWNCLHANVSTTPY